LATTLTSSTLKVKITEECILNNNDYSAINEFSISGITDVHKRILTVDTSERAYLSFANTYEYGGTFHEGRVRYIRFTNKDDTNFIKLNIEGDNSTDFSVRLDPGASYVLVSTSSTGVADFADISGNTLEDLTSIKAIADTADCDIELAVYSAGSGS
tara:strand:+ start:239 stop:709 length:471 start_codon:yes stop_codon:yes gene_type:complete